MSLRVGHLASSTNNLLAEIPAEKLNHLNNFELHFDLENYASFAFPFGLTYYPACIGTFTLNLVKKTCIY